MTITFPSETLDLNRVREIVAGQDGAVSRGDAMNRLRRSGFVEAHLDFDAVLGNPEEPSVTRSQAARHLGLMDTDAARAILVSRMTTDDELVLVSIARALGKIGDDQALAALDKAAGDHLERTRNQVGFAAGLVAHRLGVPGHELPLPQTPGFLDLPEVGTQRMVIDSDPNQVQRCLEDLAADPYGVVFDEQQHQRLRFDKSEWFLLLNREIVGPNVVANLSSRKSFFGVIAEWEKTLGGFVTTLLLLTSPKEDGTVLLHAHDPEGELIHLGEGPSLHNQGRFNLRTVARFGAPRLHLEGEINGGVLSIDQGRIATSILKRTSERMPAIPITIDSLAF